MNVIIGTNLDTNYSSGLVRSFAPEPIKAIIINPQGGSPASPGYSSSFNGIVDGIVSIPDGEYIIYDTELLFEAASELIIIGAASECFQTYLIPFIPPSTGGSSGFNGIVNGELSIPEGNYLIYDTEIFFNANSELIFEGVFSEIFQTFLTIPTTTPVSSLYGFNGIVVGEIEVIPGYDLLYKKEIFFNADGEVILDDSLSELLQSTS